MTTLATVAVPATSAGPADLPDGACDAHSHVFGPFDRHPPLRPSVYPLPEADPAAHATMRAGIGVRYGVLVQPAPYADDPSAMLDAIAASRGSLRGIAVASPAVADATLADWRDRGIVGLRFTEKRAPGGGRYPGSEPFESLVALAPRMRALRLHAQLWADDTQFAEWLPRLTRLGVPLVLDHLAGATVAAGVQAPAFQSVLAAVRDGDVHVKLSIVRAIGGADPAAARPFHDALIAAAPDRMVWGSDWPFVRMAPAPDAGALLALLARWTPDPAVLRAILVDTPARLYQLDGEQPCTV